ncbi:MAG: TonB-dependent receptor, partial [candidate division Zixibacteria bacterium]|nr:TonB-dependent receptor [candidate division Zixibacteria bacterium]
GTYALKVSHIGYEPRQYDDLVVTAGETLRLDFELTPKPISVKNIVVSPSRFAIMETTPSVQQSLSRKDIESMPQFGDDIYRAVRRLPGTSSNDYSAKFTVRGGQHDEVLVLLDGMELYEPFHLKDIDGGALSIIDVASIEGIDLMTGGFTAPYGDRMSGVFDMKSKRPPVNERKYSFGISFMNARAMSHGSFAENKGSWLFSARRGYLDLIMDMVDPESKFRPKYYDAFGKLQYQLSPSHVLSAHVLHAGDDLYMVDDEDGEADTVDTKYDNSYLWLTLHSSLKPQLTARTIASMGVVSNQRKGASTNQDLSFDGAAHDEREFDFVGIKQDWEYELSNRVLFKAGVDFRSLDASYDYFAAEDQLFVDETGQIEERIDSTEVVMESSGERIGGYLANRFRLFPQLTTELGVRYDHVSYSGDDNFSPRVNAVYTLGERTSLRGGWGQYYQSQRIHSIALEDGEDDFFPAQKAVHWALGLEHQYENGLHLRLDAYHKRYSELRPRHLNFLGDLELFGELEEDRISVMRDGTTAKGIELYLRKESSGKFTWWASYALSWVEDDVSNVLLTNPNHVDMSSGPTSVPINQTLAGPSDQRHTIYFDANYRPNHKWQMNLAWNYHTGWPFTPAVVKEVATIDGTYYDFDAGKPYSERYPAFSRVDLRINRYFNTSRGQITLFAEVINLLNQKNVRHYTYNRQWNGRSMRLTRNEEHWFKIMPSIGVMYSF